MTQVADLESLDFSRRSIDMEAEGPKVRQLEPMLFCVRGARPKSGILVHWEIRILDEIKGYPSGN